MENVVKKVKHILKQINKYGLLWKPGKDVVHLRKRKRKGHIPNDYSMKDYEQVILSILKGTDNEVYVYFLKGFEQDYFVFGDREWVVIIGENAVMETAFLVGENYDEYLEKEKGYQYIGKVKEVMENGLS